MNSELKVFATLSSESVVEPLCITVLSAMYHINRFTNLSGLIKAYL